MPDNKDIRALHHESHGLKDRLKNSVLPAGKAPRTIQTGILSGLSMDLDFACHTQRWLGLQERELNGWFRSLSQGIATALDVGAHDGMYSLYFLAKTSAKKVIAFEPSDDSLKLMERNLALNHLDNDPRLEVINRRVGTFAAGQDVSLDVFLERIQFPCLVKVDIDGGEFSLLKGAPKLLERQARWIIEVHSTELQEKCIDLLHRSNYKTVVVHNAWWRHLIPELRPIELNQWIVALPFDQWVESEFAKHPRA